VTEESTDTQKTKIIERSTRLRQKIESFYEIQNVYMPSVAFLRRQADEDCEEELPIHTVDLKLPSGCLRAPSKLIVSDELCRYEFRLRVGEAHDALDSLRRHLLLKDSIWRFRHTEVLGQRNMTRSQQVIQDVERKIKLDVARYRRAYVALALLGPRLKETTWQSVFKRLQDSDIRAFKESDEIIASAGHKRKKQSKKSKFNSTLGGEGKRTPSWIWMTTEQHSKFELTEGMYHFTISQLRSRSEV
jgi:hypothetical protein